MEGQADVQHVGLPEGVGGVRPQQGEDVLRRGQLRTGGVDVEAVALFIVIGLIAVNAEHRKQGDELDALAHDVGQGDIVRLVVIGGQVEHAAGQGVHDIAAGGLQNDIPHKIVGQGAVVGQLLLEVLQLLCVGQSPQQEQIGRLLKAKAALLQGPLHQALHVDAPIVELTVAGDLLAVHHLFGDDVGDLRQAGQNPLAVEIPQAALDVVLHIVLWINAAVLPGLGRQRLDFRGDVTIVRIARHRNPPFLLLRSSCRGASFYLPLDDDEFSIACICYQSMKRWEKSRMKKRRSLSAVF